MDLSFVIRNLFLLIVIEKQCESAQKISVVCCDWNGNYRLNLIPHPVTCLAFYQCEPIRFSDGSFGTLPTLTECPLDEEGREMYYDFRECRCLRKEEATCYDDRTPGHYEDFFKCTENMVEQGVNITCF